MSTSLSTSMYNVFIFVVFLSFIFPSLQLSSHCMYSHRQWTILHSISLFSFYVLGDFLSLFPPLQYIPLLPEGISSSFRLLCLCLSSPVSSLPPLSPSYALSLTHYRHITCPTARSRPENPSNSQLSSLHLHLPQEEKGNYHPLHERAHNCARNGASPPANPHRDACLARNSDLKPE